MGEKELDRPTAPGGAVDDRLSVRHEAGRADRAPLRGQLPVGDRCRPRSVPRAELPAREEKERAGGKTCERETHGAPPRRREGTQNRGRGVARRAPEGECEVARGLEPLLRALLETVAHDALEAGRDRLVRDREIGRILLAGSPTSCRPPSRPGRRGGPRASRRGSRRRRRGRSARRRVCPRTCSATCSRESPGRRRAPCRRSRWEGSSPGAALLLMRELGEAEVEDLDAAVVRDEEVLRLQIPVDDPLLVRRGEPVRDLERVVGRLAGGELAAGQGRAEGLALEELLDDVGSAVYRSDVVDGGDVRVVENARRLGLLLEAAQAVGVLREGGRQDLDRDLAGETRVLRAVHLAHAPGADLARGSRRGRGGFPCQRHGGSQFPSPPSAGERVRVRGKGRVPHVARNPLPSGERGGGLPRRWARGSRRARRLPVSATWRMPISPPSAGEGEGGLPRRSARGSRRVRGGSRRKASWLLQGRGPVDEHVDRLLLRGDQLVDDEAFAVGEDVELGVGRFVDNDLEERSRSCPSGRAKCLLRTLP